MKKKNAAKKKRAGSSRAEKPSRALMGGSKRNYDRGGILRVSLKGDLKAYGATY